VPSSSAFDANFLTLVLYPAADPPNDPSTGRPVERAGQRIALLLDQLSKDGERIIIPTPVLAEVLVLVGAAGPEYVLLLDRSARFEIAAFDEKAAIENAVTVSRAIATGDKRSGLDKTPWQKIKIDRQIVAIAKVRGAKMIYSTDSDIATLARQSDIAVRHLADIAVPDDDLPLFKLNSDSAIAPSSTEPSPPVKRSPDVEQE
jgi:predicted nucleic acid-binding protein